MNVSSKGQRVCLPLTLDRNIAELTADDYFRRSREFRLWLKERRDLTLDKLSSRDAHAQFDTFVRRWNAGELKGRALMDVADTCHTLRHVNFNPVPLFKNAITRWTRLGRPIQRPESKPVNCLRTSGILRARCGRMMDCSHLMDRMRTCICARNLATVQRPWQ